MIFFHILVLLIVIYLVIYFSTLKIDIKDFTINNKNSKYLILIKLVLFNKISLLKLKFNKEKIQKWQNPTWNKLINKNLLKAIKELNITISKLDLKLNIGTQDAALTSFIVTAIYSIISILLSNTTERINKQKYNYLIAPYYIGRNFFEIKFNCIINVKVVHIINMIKNLRKKESRFNEGTSNRRINDHSNEQHTGYGRCKYNYWRTN